MNELKVQAGFKYKFIKNFTYSADGSYRYAKQPASTISKKTRTW